MATAFLHSSWSWLTSSQYHCGTVLHQLSGIMIKSLRTKYVSEQNVILVRRHFHTTSVIFGMPKFDEQSSFHQILLPPIFFCHTVFTGSGTHDFLSNIYNTPQQIVLSGITVRQLNCNNVWTYHCYNTIRSTLRACTLAVLYYWTVYLCSVQIESITTWSTIMASSESQESSSSVSSASRYRVSSSEETYDVNERSSESSSRGLIAKKNTSCVWTYFGFVLVHLAIHSTAILLHVDYVSAKWSNTSNLLNHLKMHQPMEYTEVKRA